MSHEIRLVEGFPERDFAQIAALASGIGPLDESAVRAQLAGRQKVLTCLASVEGTLAGYKIGFQDRPFSFESWLGGVAAAFRRRGIANALMQAQHRWCREQGLSIVSTVTEGSNQPMLIANLQAGFEVCGTFLDRRRILKVILQKHLDPAGQ